MRTTIDLTDDWEEAARVLGTRGKSETVNRALAHVLAERRRAQAVETFRTVNLDLDPETMRGAWE
ncbi:antitoxin of type II TA system, VapB [Nocardia amikacinitolerans]|uniref:type II toxin-antitoxin system VapB family antitoxin n=1 Tax=Nocardia amikacinitolerans TaxID=756689 RepID=UPI000AEACABC|nr:type II toxin-antitoxin system VapB family antitoxin [Nocardia amikacinitolerans]MCP2319955.1 antitoxin of type II TA system, VapB [Nocardia amikacinitolerans]